LSSIANPISSKEDKTHINVVVIGHVDSGKSTTVSNDQSASAIARGFPELADKLHRPAISSTSAVVSTSVPSRSSRRSVSPFSNHHFPITWAFDPNPIAPHFPPILRRFSLAFWLCGYPSLIKAGEGHTNPDKEIFFPGAHGPTHPASPSLSTFNSTPRRGLTPDNRKPLSSARVPSSMRGFLTSSRPSVSVVSPSISPSGSSRPPSTMSPSSVCLSLASLCPCIYANVCPSQMPPAIVISSRT